MPPFTLWHNPRCSKSRAALEWLRARGVEPEVRAYLDDPPTVAELTAVAASLGSVRAMLRDGEPEAAELGLSSPDVSDTQLIAAMAVHPRLIQRPILLHASGDGVRAEIGRPTERLVRLLPS